MQEEIIINGIGDELELSPVMRSFCVQLPKVELPAGRYLLHRCSEPGGIYFLIRGVARSYFDGQPGISQRIYSDGDAILGPAYRYTAGGGFRFVKCLQDCQFYHLKRSVMEAAMLCLPQMRYLVVLLKGLEGQRQLQRKAITDIHDWGERLDYAMQAQPHLGKILTPEELADYLGMDGWFVRQLLKSNKKIPIPA